VQVWAWRDEEMMALGTAGLELFSLAPRTILPGTAVDVALWTTGAATPGP
jgi:hypothetical protein